jgi:multidrug efflux system membrane fusion protein
MSRRNSKKLLVSAAILALIAGGFIAANMGSDNPASAQMGGEMPAMPVPVYEVSEKPVQIWKEFSGKLTAVDFVEIRPQVSGLIEQVHFTDGQIVKKGDLLFTIDQRPYAAAVAEARAQVASANDDHVYAKKELERAGELAKTGALSKAVYDQRVNAEKVARSAITSANARLKSAQVDLDRATIEAPIDGRVGREEITVGNLVNAAAAPLLTTIVSDKEIYADFDVDDQTYMRYIRLKSNDNSVESERAIPVRMKLSNDDKYYEGTIKSFDNRLDASSGTIRARATFTNEDGALLPGMFAQVQLSSAGEEVAMLIPEKAIGTDQSRKFVYVVDENSIAAYREVKLGDLTGGERIILSGLKTGDKVIVDNLMKLRPGAKVQAMSPEQLQQMKSGAAAPQAAASTAEESTSAQPKTSEAPVIELPESVSSETAENSEDVPLIITEESASEQSSDQTPAAPAQE